MSEQGPIVTGPDRKRSRSSPEVIMLALFSIVGLIGFIATFVFVVIRAVPDSQAAPSPPPAFMQRAGASGPPGPAGPAGPRGAQGDSGIRILRNDCGTATCSVECKADELVLTAYCTSARLPATYTTDREALCRSVTGRGRIDIVAACVKITNR